MVKENWRDKFREFYPNAIERRVPIDETPEEIISEIDSSLKYTGRQLGEGYSMGNKLYVVRDSSDGLEKVLKVASAPANIDKAQNEHLILQKLNENNIIGIPRAFRFYNSGSEYNQEKFTAMLREYVDAEEFYGRLRGEDAYRKLNNLTIDMNRLGVTLPRDFNGWNVRVDEKGQPYLLDLEESVLCDKPVFNPRGNYEKLHGLFVSNVREHLEKSKNPLKRLLSQSPEAVKIVSNLFYKGPAKNSWG